MPQPKPAFNPFDDEPKQGALPVPASDPFADFTPPTQTAEPGGRRKPLQAGMEAAKTQLTVGLPYGLQKAGIGTLTPEEEASYKERLRTSAARREELLPGGPQRWDEIKSVGDASAFLVENVAVSAPQMLATGAGAIAGAAAGAPAGPPGAVIGGGAGAVATGTPFFVGSNVEAATDSGEKDLLQSQARKSVAVAPGQAALDALIGKFVPGVRGKLPGGVPTPTGGIVTRTGKQAAGAAATEGVTEGLQQVGERFAAEKSLTDAEALAEYRDAAITGAAVGGAIGAATGPFAGERPQSNFDADAETGDVGRPTPSPAPEGPARPPIEPGAQGDLFTLDDVLDLGIGPVETGNDPAQVSEKGAKGKYQLLPSTAKAMATRLGVKFDEERLLKDEKYNRTLAREYLTTLLERYDGDTFLAVTAYHAGEGNVDSWMRRFNYDRNDRQSFVEQIEKAGNPRSAQYPMKVLAAMGRADFDGVGTAEFTTPAVVDDYDLSQGAIVATLRTATMTDAGVAAPADKGMLSLANKLSTSLNAADLDKATKAVDREKAKLAKAVEELANEQTALSEGKAQHTPEEQARYQADLDARLSKLVKLDKVIDAADQLVVRFAATMNTSQPDLFAGAPPAQPQQADALPRESAPPQAARPEIITEPPLRGGAPFGRRPTLPSEPQPSQAPPAAETKLAQDLSLEAANEFSAQEEARIGILDEVLSDPTTRSPLSRFVARLKRIGLDPTPTSRETEMIAAFEDRFEPSAPDESGNFGIPERGSKQPVARATAAGEPTQEPAPPPVEERITGNVRTRAETRADQLGSSQRAWFLRGVDVAMGEADTPAPTSPSKARWFNMGKEFVEQERATQEREAGVKTEPKPTRREQLRAAIAKTKEPKEAPVTRKAPFVRGDRNAFLKAVDDAVGVKITKRQAQQLKMLEDVRGDLGGIDAKLTPTRQLWTMLDETIADNNTKGSLPAEDTGLPTQKRKGRASMGDAQVTLAGDVIREQRRFEKAFQTELNRMGLTDVTAMANTVVGMRILYKENTLGVFLTEQETGFGPAIDIAWNQTEVDPTHILDHEVIHAMRELDLFTEGEWNTLEKFAVDAAINGQYGLREFIGRYANDTRLNDADLREELVAELYAQWSKENSLDGAPRTINTALGKIKKFLIAMARALKIIGEPAAVNIMRAIKSGEIGRRERGPTLTEQGRRLGEDFDKPPVGRFRRADLPPAAKKSSKAIQASVEDAVKKGHIWMAFTEDLANMAVKSLPSAKQFIELHSRNFALSRDFEERLLEIKKAYEGLPARARGTGKGSISEFLYDSRMAGKWGFKPEYSEAAEVDPELARRFKAMPKAMQDVVKAVFRFNHDARNQLYQATISAINAEYDPLIEAATDKEKPDLQKEKARVMAHFSRVFDTKAGVPYTPLKRDGNWVVVGRSAEYAAAKEAGDQEAMDKLRSDPAHYFVDFRDTAYEAEALRQNVAQKFPSNAAFERSQVTDQDVGGSELHMAFQQLKTAVEQEAKAKPGSKAAKELHRLAVDLYLHTLSDTSARKGELSAELVPAKDPVTGEVMDMMRAFVTRGQATTHYIASISNNLEIQKAIKGMKAELSATDGKARTDAARVFNELMWRYVKNLTQQPSRFVDKVARGVSVFNLLLSPFYYLQNATQAVLLSQPLVAARVGYPRAMAEFNKAYADFAKMTAGVQITDRVDFKKAPADVRAMLQRLADRGRLDAGFTMELGHWEMNGEGALPTAWNKVDRFLRMAPQRVEVMNRAVTGMAAYRAGRKAGMSDEDAFQFASKVVYDSHGDYSAFNAPKPWAAMGPASKIVLQFRKFQFIMASLVAREFHRTFKGASKAEKIAGARALGFVAAHMALVGGIVGQPAMALFGPMVGTVLNALDEDDDKDYSEWKEELRKFLGAGQDGEDRNWMADLLFKGAPYALLGADTSERLGMGNMLSLSPYSDIGEATKDRDGLYKFMGQMLSGAAGGIVGKMVDGWAYAREDDYARALESASPGVIGGVQKARRLTTEGVTSRSGDVLIKPEDISGLDAFFTAIGVQPRQLANQAERRSTVFKAEQHYDSKTTTLKRKYNDAARRDDRERMTELRQEWDALQEARERDGFKRQPLSSLLRSPSQQRKREGRVVGGVPTSPTTRGFVEMMFEEAE